MNPLRRQEIPAPKPVLTITVLVVALLFPLALLIWDFHEVWTPLEREYLLTYLTTGRGGSGDSRLLVIDYADSRRLLADDREAVPAPTTATGNWRICSCAGMASSPWCRDAGQASRRG